MVGCADRVVAVSRVAVKKVIVRDNKYRKIVISVYFRGVEQAIGTIECLVVKVLVLTYSFLHKSLELRKMMLIDFTR